MPSLASLSLSISPRSAHAGVRANVGELLRHVQFSPVPDLRFDRSTTRFRALAERHCAPVAQLDRASDYESEGRTFESFRARQFFKHLAGFWRPSFPAGDTAGDTICRACSLKPVKCRFAGTSWFSSDSVTPRLRRDLTPVALGATGNPCLGTQQMALGRRERGAHGWLSCCLPQSSCGASRPRDGCRTLREPWALPLSSARLTEVT